MQMESHEAQEQRPQTILRKQCEHAGDNQRTRPAVRQIVVILLVVIIVVRLTGNRGNGHVCDQSHAIKIRQDARQRYEFPITRMIGRD